MNRSLLSVLAFAGTLTAGAVVPGTPVIVPNNGKAQSESLVPMRPMKSAVEIKGLTRSAEQPQTEFVATEASFYCYGDLYGNGNNAYYLFLSNGRIDKGNPTETCQIVRTLVFAPAADTDEMTLPTGTFTLADTGEAGTFNPDYTDFMDVFPYPENPEEGLVAYTYLPVDGTVEIARNDNGGYRIEIEYTGVLLDNDGKELDRAVCKVSYDGEAEYVDIYAYTPLDGDVELNIPNLSGRYMEGDFTLTFYSVELDEEGWIIGPGDLFNTELFSENVAPMNTGDLEGTYTPVDVFGEGMIPGRFMQGVWYDMFGGNYAAIGTALTVYDENVNPSKVGLAVDGTVTVTKVGEEHLFVFDLVTAEGHKLTGSWQGVVADYVTDFSDPSGIGGVSTGEAVRGGHGCIVAPEGSEVYTVSGIRTGVTGLAPGIYIVRSTSGVSKVVVR